MRSLSWEKLGWDSAGDLKLLMENQPNLVDDFLSEKLKDIRSFTSIEEKFAAFWCINNLVLLSQFYGGTLPIIFYESQCAEPEVQISEIFKIICIDYDEKNFVT